MLGFPPARKDISLVCVLSVCIDESKGRMGINSDSVVVLLLCEYLGSLLGYI